MSQKKAAVKHDPLQAQRPFDADEVLSDVERELPVLLRSLIAALWYILAAALSASAVAYIAISNDYGILAVVRNRSSCLRLHASAAFSWRRQRSCCGDAN